MTETAGAGAGFCLDLEQVGAGGGNQGADPAQPLTQPLGQTAPIGQAFQPHQPQTLAQTPFLTQPLQSQSLAQPPMLTQQHQTPTGHRPLVAQYGHRHHNRNHSLYQPPIQQQPLTQDLSANSSVQPPDGRAATATARSSTSCEDAAAAAASSAADLEQQIRELQKKLAEEKVARLLATNKSLELQLEQERKFRAEAINASQREQEREREANQCTSSMLFQLLRHHQGGVPQGVSAPSRSFRPPYVQPWTYPDDAFMGSFHAASTPASPQSSGNVVHRQKRRPLPSSGDAQPRCKKLRMPETPVGVQPGPQGAVSADTQSAWTVQVSRTNGRVYWWKPDSNDYAMTRPAGAPPAPPQCQAPQTPDSFRR